MSQLNRRKFIQSIGVLTAALPLGASAFDFVPSKGNGFSFVLLGDLHYDKPEHHDMGYVQKRYPNDIVQIENYSRITKENYPLLMNVVKEKSSATNADFLLQLGDFVEGLCGSEILAQQQTTEFIASIKALNLNRPFFVVKGNHDITGEGAREIYRKTVLPWQGTELNKTLSTANATFVHKKTRFIIFDCYTANESLEWLKGVLAETREKTVFFCVHQPIVPYNARSNWHVFAKSSEQQKRNELLNLLGKHHAIVLTGHLHKTSIVKRATSEGAFMQLAIGSVISSPDAKIKDHIAGIENYQPDLVNLEPNFNPASLQERRSNLEQEKPHINHFEYADFCGYSTVAVGARGNVLVSIYANIDQEPWKVIDVTAILKG